MMFEQKEHDRRFGIMFYVTEGQIPEQAVYETEEERDCAFDDLMKDGLIRLDFGYVGRTAYPIGFTKFDYGEHFYRAQTFWGRSVVEGIRVNADAPRQHP